MSDGAYVSQCRACPFQAVTIAPMLTHLPQAHAISSEHGQACVDVVPVAPPEDATA